MSVERCVICECVCSSMEWDEELCGHRCLDCALFNNDEDSHDKIKKKVLKELQDDEESYMAGFE